MKTRRGFTLVELLTVIVIILMLAGITMKLMALVNRKTGVTRAARDIERFRHALTEYYTINGCYPPVSGMESQFEADEGLRPTSPPDGGCGYFDGLTAYLFPGGANTGPWAKYLVGWDYESVGGPVLMEGNNRVAGKLQWMNKKHTIKDPFGNDYIYQSTAPYQDYLLYSKGPDKNDPADDIGKNKWME